MCEEKNEITIYQEEKALEDQVNNTANELSKQIAKAESKNELDSLYDVFKINDAKKNVFRINKLNNLLDKVTDEAIARFENRPGEMSNKEVIDYMNAVQTQIDKSKNIVEETKNVNLTQVNHNSVNININNEHSNLNRESRERIIDFIKDILDNNSSDVIDVVDPTEHEGGNEEND